LIMAQLALKSNDSPRIGFAEGCSMLVRWVRLLLQIDACGCS
jgi:hypothetical protein